MTRSPERSARGRVPDSPCGRATSNMWQVYPVDENGLESSQLTMLRPAKNSPTVAALIDSGITCVAFILRMRSIRASEQCWASDEPLDVPEVREDAAGSGSRPYSSAFSSEASDGGGELAGRRQCLHRAVARPGRDQRADRCAAIEGEIERSLRPLDSFLLREPGGRTRMKTRRSISSLREKLGGAAELVQGHRLFSRSRISGWAVSRPIATSS